MRDLFKDGLNQMWFNAQKMEKDERERAIKNIIATNAVDSSFIDCGAKYLIANLIDHSQPYYNGLGYYTKVEEFDELGWYDEKGNLDFKKVYYVAEIFNCENTAEKWVNENL
jgi:hypothetical protein